MLELCCSVLQALQVQCEAQVLLFVLDYIDSTEIGADAAAQLFQHVSSLCCIITSCHLIHIMRAIYRFISVWTSLHASRLHLADKC